MTGTGGPGGRSATGDDGAGTVLIRPRTITFSEGDRDEPPAWRLTGRIDYAGEAYTFTYHWSDGGEDAEDDDVEVADAAGADAGGRDWHLDLGPGRTPLTRRVDRRWLCDAVHDQILQPAREAARTAMQHALDDLVRHLQPAAAVPPEQAPTDWSQDSEDALQTAHDLGALTGPEWTVLLPAGTGGRSLPLPKIVRATAAAEAYAAARGLAGWEEHIPGTPVLPGAHPGVRTAFIANGGDGRRTLATADAAVRRDVRRAVGDLVAARTAGIEVRTGTAAGPAGEEEALQRVHDLGALTGPEWTVLLTPTDPGRGGRWHTVRAVGPQQAAAAVAAMLGRGEDSVIAVAPGRVKGITTPSEPAYDVQEAVRNLVAARVADAAARTPQPVQAARPGAAPTATGRPPAAGRAR